LIQDRPDIRSAYYAVLSADSDLAAALANRFPRLSLTAEAEISGEHSRDLFDNWLATLASNLAAPLIDGGTRKAEVDRTRSAVSEALHTYGQTILDALSEVEDALAKERHQRDFIQSLETQLKLAGQVSDRMRDRYLQGTVDYQRVLDALLSQQTLEQSVLSARRDLVQDRIDLCRALGTGWELERPEQDQPDASMVTDTNTSSPNGKISG
jgi:outer membrane protein TolC